MSGLEVAGVVLGSLPLVISALEHYSEGINTVRRYRRYKIELRSLILQINTESGIFINTLEQLLTGIVRIELMADYLSEPGGDKWQTVGKALENRLRGAYDVYLDNVRGMETSLKQMMEKLALAPDGKPQFTDTNSFKSEFKRLKFSIKKSEYSGSLNDLRNHNQALIRLTQQSLDLELSRSRNRGRCCPNFKAIQVYARNLYNTLLSGLQCTGAGCHGHGVKLRLENRTSNDKDEDTLIERTAFRLIFAPATEQSRNKDHYISTSCKEVEIRCLVSPSISTGPTTSSYSVLPASSKRVRFAGPCVPQSSGTTTITLVAQPTAPASIAASQHIKSLCEAIGKLQKPRSDTYVGYLLDPANRKQGIYSLDSLQNCSQQQWTSYSLRHILTKRDNMTQGLTQLNKLQVATSLSSSILQLYSTSWLDDNWGSSEVFFVHRPGTPAASIYQHPFVYRGLIPQAVKGTLPSQRKPSRVIRNQTLFTLGVLLLELWYGKPIEELQSASDLNCQGTPGVAWCTAMRLAEEDIEFQAGKRYADAVRRCIRCDFNQTDPNLENEDFQQAVFEGVVVPIERTLEQFQGII